MKNRCSRPPSRGRTLAERIAFLDEACGDDLALRRRLELLLAGHDRSAGILDQPVSPPPSIETIAHVVAGDAQSE